MTLGELTPEQRQRFTRLSVALQKAVDGISASGESLVKIRACGALRHARALLQNSGKNTCDIRTSVFVGQLNKDLRTEVMKVIRSNPGFTTLHAFGSVPWTIVQVSFDDAGIECPLELSSFHAAYQEELSKPS